MKSVLHPSRLALRMRFLNEIMSNALSIRYLIMRRMDYTQLMIGQRVVKGTRFMYNKYSLNLYNCTIGFLYLTVGLEGLRYKHNPKKLFKE